MRLLLGAAVTILAALAAAWGAMVWLFERHIERRVEAELVREATQVVAGLRFSADGELHLDRMPADARFERAASGVYWQVGSADIAIRSRSLWDQSLPPARGTSDRWSMRIEPGPHEHSILLVERAVQPERDRGVVQVQFAHERASLQVASVEFGAELALFLLVLWLLLSAAAGLYVHLGLRPLAAVRREVEHLQRHPAARLSDTYATEIEPLTRAINELADARERDLARARRRAADLAHGLKTPLAALAAQSRRARALGASDAADGLDTAIAAAAAAVEAELTRTRAAAMSVVPQGAAAALLPAVENVVSVIERTEFGGHLVPEIEIDAALHVPMAHEDLTELMGALIENAARFAHRRLRVSAGEVAPHAAPLVRVEDDGPGMELEEIERTLALRADQAVGMRGRGLIIARELADASGASLELQRSDLGGLCVAVRWRRGVEPLS